MKPILMPRLFLIDQTQSPHTYYVQLLNITGSWEWWIVLRPNDPRSILPVFDRGFETPERALDAWTEYFQKQWPESVPPKPVIYLMSRLNRQLLADMQKEVPHVVLVDAFQAIPAKTDCILQPGATVKPSYRVPNDCPIIFLEPFSPSALFDWINNHYPKCNEEP